MSKNKQETSTNLDKELESFLESFEKEFKGNKLMIGDSMRDNNIEKLHSGSYNLDSILGGGLPFGRVIEVYGGEGSGKTSLCLHIAREAQKKGIRVGYIDMEHSLNPDFCRKIGVDTSKLAITQPDYGEQAIEMIHKIVSSGLFKVVIIDSVAALTPKAELEGEVGDAVIGKQAKLMSQLMRKINPETHKTSTLLVFVNQLRDNIGGYGQTKVTTGGKALRFYASIRLELARTGYIKQGDDPIGQTIKVKTVKNKIYPPFKTTNISLLYDKGFSVEDEIIDIALSNNIFTKKGSWYYYQDISIGQGLNKVRETLEANTEMMNEVIEKINNNNTNN